MAVGPFLSVDTGFADLLSASNFAASALTVALVDHASATTLAARGTITYDDISTDVEVAVAVPSPSVAVQPNKVRFTHTKATFTADGSVTGRFAVYILGTYNDLQTTDKVFGYVDLNDAEANLSSVDAEFSFTPHANGLFEISRSAAPA